MEATNHLQLRAMPKKDRDQFFENMYQLAESMNSFFIIEDGADFTRFNTEGLIENKIPIIKISDKVFLGPGTALENISVQEYRIAHTSLINYQNEPNDVDLCMLIASLYLPLDESTQARSTFNENTVELRAKLFSSLPYSTKLGIFLWYQACEIFLSSGTFYVEGIEINLSELYSKKDSDSAIDEFQHRMLGDIGFLGVLFALAQDLVFGGIEVVENQKLYTVLLRLYQVHKQAKK
jgi:hypothetical protein